METFFSKSLADFNVNIDGVKEDLQSKPLALNECLGSAKVCLHLIQYVNFKKHNFKT